MTNRTPFENLGSTSLGPLGPASSRNTYKPKTQMNEIVRLSKMHTVQEICTMLSIPPEMVQMSLELHQSHQETMSLDGSTTFTDSFTTLVNRHEGSQSDLTRGESFTMDMPRTLMDDGTSLSSSFSDATELGLTTDPCHTGFIRPPSTPTVETQPAPTKMEEEPPAVEERVRRPLLLRAAHSVWNVILESINVAFVMPL